MGRRGCSVEYVVLPRLHIGSELSLSTGQVLALPEAASRHVQVLRMQPGEPLHLFDGQGSEWLATVSEMGRKVVQVRVEQAVRNDRELPAQVTLAMGMPANDRMDALVEKAAELGVYAIQPLMCERSVLRLDGDRATKKVAHWQAVAVSACEQSGRSVVPTVHEVKTLGAWLKAMQDGGGMAPGLRRGVLSLREAVSMRAWLQDGAAPGARAGSSDATDSFLKVAAAGARLGEALATSANAVEAPSQPSGSGNIGHAGEHLPQAAHPGQHQYVFLSGPEGGLSPAEEAQALDAGWRAITLGPRVLRADTAPLAALSVISAFYEQ